MKNVRQESWLFLYANFYKTEWSEWTNNLAIYIYVYIHADFIHNCLEERKTESTGGSQNSIPNNNNSNSNDDDYDDEDYNDEQEEEEESATVREVKKDNEFEWKKKKIKRHTQIVQYSYASFRLLLRRSHIELYEYASHIWNEIGRTSFARRPFGIQLYLTWVINIEHDFS